MRHQVALVTNARLRQNKKTRRARIMKTFAELNFPGRLIAVEGLDGSGKSTQIYLLKRWLEAEGIKVYFSEWNSSELVKSATSKGKKRELLTPMGLRTLSSRDPAYRGRYEGDASQRDAAYHQGTVWPWLIGPFVDAWLRVHGDDAMHRAQARRRFLVPMLESRVVAGPGHLCEIADGDDPHTSRGCPFQAWSLGEWIRMWSRTEAPLTASRSAASA